MDLLAAIARRDADPEDLMTELCEQRADALDVIVSLAARAAQPRPDPAAAQSWIDVSQFAKRTDTPAAARLKHHLPRIPFVLNGTLYDPQDIERFNGRELHFVLAKDEPLLVIDERPLIAKWWELTYLTSVVAGAEKAEQYQYGGHQTVSEPQTVTPQRSPWPKDPYIPLKPKGTYFYEHAHYRGDSLHLRPNREFRDLSKVGRGFLGLGDWNDIISSVQMYFTYVCVLHEHIGGHAGGGMSLTLFSNGTTRFLANLEDVGWNDQASWVATW